MRLLVTGLFCLCALAACQSGTAPPALVTAVRITVSDVNTTSTPSYVGLSFAVRVENIGESTLTLPGCGVPVFTLSPALGWIEVSSSACPLYNADSSLVPGQAMTLRASAGGSPSGVGWPAGGVAGTYRVTPVIFLGTRLLDVALRTSDPFVVPAPAAR